MPKATPTELVSAAQVYVQDHDCRYAHELLESEEILEAQRNQQIGATARILTKIDTLLLDLSILHNHPECPPAYVGQRMTHEWMTWTGELNVAESTVRSALGNRATLAA